MNFKLLKEVLKSNFAQIHVNEYKPKNEAGGSLGIARRYIDSIPDLSYETEKRATIKTNIYYKKNKIGHIWGQTTSLSKPEVRKISNNKILTEKLLSNAGIKTPITIPFELDEVQLAKHILTYEKKDMVLKPSNLNRGRGVTVGVNNKNIEEAWQKSVDAYHSYGIDSNKMLVLQEKVMGMEARLYVVNNKFVSAILRVPSHIIGDGTHNIETLIEHKNHLRNLNPYLKGKVILLDLKSLSNLEKQNMNPDTIPHKDEIVFLQDSPNIGLGGENLEFSHLVGENLISIAEKSIKAIPGMKNGGVDIFFNHFNDENATVTELDTNANISTHQYPFKGERKYILHYLIDSMLAEMKNI